MRKDLEMWPRSDCKGRLLKEGDRVSMPRYPRGTVRGRLVCGDVCIVGGEEYGEWVLETDEGDRYPVTSKVRKLR